MKKTLFYEGVFPEIRALNFGIALMITYFLFEFGSLQFFYPIITDVRLPFTLAVSCILYVGILFFGRRLAIRDALSRFFIIFCLFMIIHSHISTIEAGHAEQNIKLFTTFMMNYLIIITVVKEPKQYILLIDCWLLAIAYSCVHAFFQGGKIWGSQWLNDENQISAMLVTAIPFAFFLILNSTSNLKKAFYAGCIGLYITVVVLSFSRGGFVALLIVAFLCWLTTEKKVFSAGVIIISVFCVFSFAPPDFFSEMETIKEGTQESTAGARIYQWRLATQMFSDHPLFGIGPLNYPYYYSRYDQLNDAKYYVGRKLVLHSTPFTYLSETGIVGTSLIILLHVLLFRNWRITKSFSRHLQKLDDVKIFVALGNACVIAQVGFITASIFLHLVPFPFFWILVPLSESLKRIKINFVRSLEVESNSPEPELSVKS